MNVGTGKLINHFFSCAYFF